MTKIIKTNRFLSLFPYSIHAFLFPKPIISNSYHTKDTSPEKNPKTSIVSGTFKLDFQYVIHKVQPDFQKDQCFKGFPTTQNRPFAWLYFELCKKWMDYQSFGCTIKCFCKKKTVKNACIIKCFLLLILQKNQCFKCLSFTFLVYMYTDS